MSSNSTSSSNSFGGSPLLGGMPSHADIAPSVIFIIVYAALIPILLWRALRPSTRTLVLIRPGIFILVRVITYIIRVLLADGHVTTTIFVIEEVFLAAGMAFLLEPLASLAQALIKPYLPDPKNTTNPQGAQLQPHRVQQLCRLLRIIVLVVVILTVYSSSLYKKAENGDQSSIDSLQMIKTASSALFLVVIVGINGVVLLANSTVSGIQRRPSMFLMGTTVPLFIVAVYRLVEQHLSFSSDINKAAPFYILFCAPEVIGTALLIAPDLVTLFNLRVEAGSMMQDNPYAKPLFAPSSPEGLGYTNAYPMQNQNSNGSPDPYPARDSYAHA